MSIHLAGVSGKGNRFNTRWQQNSETKGHPVTMHGPYHIPIICHLLDPSTFSLSTTFKNPGQDRSLEKLFGCISGKIMPYG
jgi:hypothetical protein